MYVSKGLKEALTVLIVTHVTQESEVVFVAFTQHYIQSTVISIVTHIKRVGSVKYYVLYSVYRASHPCQEGRLFEPSILGV